MLIKITGLPGSMSNNDLINLVDPFGKVLSAHIVIDAVTQKSKRFGFVEMSNHKDAELLMQVLNGKSLNKGQTLKIQEVERHAY